VDVGLCPPLLTCTQYDEAYALLKKALVHAINEPAIHIGLGRLLGNYMNNPKDALYHLKKAATLNHESAEPQFRLAQYYEKYNQPGEAEKCYKKAISMNPKFPTLLTNWAFFLTKLKKNHEAVEQFKAAIALDSTDFIAESNLAYLLTTVLEKHTESVPHFLRAIELNPKEARTHNNYGFVLATHLNDKKEALVQYRKDISLWPNYANAHYNLGMLLLEHFQQPREAFFHFEKVISLKPRHANAHYQIGFILETEFQKKADAIIHYRKALACDSSHQAASVSLAAGAFIPLPHNDIISSQLTWLSKRANSNSSNPTLPNRHCRTLPRPSHCVRPAKPQSVPLTARVGARNRSFQNAAMAPLIAIASPEPQEIEACLACLVDCDSLHHQAIVAAMEVRNKKAQAEFEGKGGITSPAAEAPATSQVSADAELHTTARAPSDDATAASTTLHLDSSAALFEQPTASELAERLFCIHLSYAVLMPADVLHESSTKRPLTRSALEKCLSIHEELSELGNPLPDPESVPNVEYESLGICYRI
jgi:tetratricopeptide (TPR) repeat protein